MRIVWLFVYLASVHSAIVKRNEGIPVSGQRTANLLALAKRDNARAANLVSRCMTLPTFTLKCVAHKRATLQA